MKILQFRAENFKRLKVVEIEPKDNTIQITGRNGSGKSSILDSIFAALAGKNASPDDPIRHGATSAQIKLRVGELSITRNFTAGGSTLKVESRGDKVSSPQALLDAMMGELTFDPLEFTRMKKREQFDELRKVVPLEIDLDEFSRKDEADYNERHDKNLTVRQLQARIDAIAVDETLPKEIIDSTELAKQLNDIQQHNAVVAIKQSYKEQLKVEAERIARDFNQKLEKLEADKAATQSKIMELQAQLLVFDSMMTEAGRKYNEDMLKVSEREASILIPEPKSTDDIVKKISEITETNERIKVQLQRQRLIDEQTKAQAEAITIDDRMQERQRLKDEALAKAKMPAPGLTFGDGCIMLNGVPFDQASSAEQLRVSVGIAMAANPELKILRVKDGSLLDSNSMEILKQMITEHDYQCWIEKVDESGKIGIYMEDGEVAIDNTQTGKENTNANTDSN